MPMPLAFADASAALWNVISAAFTAACVAAAATATWRTPSAAVTMASWI
jgi:hypothetical protein